MAAVAGNYRIENVPTGTYIIIHVWYSSRLGALPSTFTRRGTTVIINEGNFNIEVTGP